jgi:hypothetical protein
MPALKPKTRGNTQVDKLSARVEDRDSTTPEPQQDINDAIEGRTYLEHHLLLCPPGEPPTHNSLATCLHQIAVMKGVTKPAMNAIRAVAFLLGEMEETQINEILKEAFNTQITELTSDMAMLIEDAKEKLNGHFKETETRLTQLVDKAAIQVTQPRQAQSTSYAAIANNPPPHANPRVAAKEGIKARQFLLEGLTNTKFSHIDVFQIKTEFNNLLAGLGLTNGKIRSISKIRNGGALIEMDSDAATAWLSEQENRDKLCNKIGPGVSFRSRVHNLIAFNVPLGLSPENQSHRQEICEANSLDPDTITVLKWVKPVHRRTQTQRTAHLFLTFSNADAANRAITNGLYICNRRCHAERVKREPTRCLKCQGWNHFAKECTEEQDRCGNCTKNHRTSDCPTPLTRACVSCKTDDHASWSRECPTFVKKQNEFNDRNPENTLQYIPTADPWTWTASAQPSQPQTQPPSSRPPINREKSQPPKKHQGSRQTDSYVPRKYDSYVPDYREDRSAGKRPQDKDWTRSEQSEQPRQSQQQSIHKDLIDLDLMDSRPLTQDYINQINGEASSGPSNTTSGPTPLPTN